MRKLTKAATAFVLAMLMGHVALMNAVAQADEAAFYDGKTLTFIVGTSAGTWAWAEIDPASKLPQGNPPSGVAAWYCLVDAVAIAGAGPVLQAFTKTAQVLQRQRA